MRHPLGKGTPNIGDTLLEAILVHFNVLVVLQGFRSANEFCNAAFPAGLCDRHFLSCSVCHFEKGTFMLYRFGGKQPTVGENSYVSELATVIGDVVIGVNCYIGHGAILRGDYGRIEIGDSTAVEEGAIIHAPPGDTNRIGMGVTIGHGALVHGKHIGDRAVIGMGAILSLWSEIGERTIIAEGTVVKLRQKIPPKVVAAGNPMKIVRELNAKDEEFWNWGKQLYVDLARKYLDEGMEPVPRKE